MAFDFPTNPTFGQVYEPDNAVYTWDGEKWIMGTILPAAVAADQDKSIDVTTTPKQ